MSCYEKFTRIQMRQTNNPLEVPTVPIFNPATPEDWDNPAILPTDLLDGEFFVNTNDKKLYIRMDDTISQIQIGTGTTLDTFTTGATLNGNIIEFDRNDGTNAYSVDLSPVLTGVSINTLYTANGTIDENRTVTIEDSQLIFTGDTDSLIGFQVGDANNNATDATSSILSFKGLKRIESGNTDENYFRAIDGITELVAERNSVQTRLRLGANQSMTISSQDSNFPGVVYDINYSSNYTNRSLVDKEYVDNAISGFTGGTNTFVTGGTFDGSQLTLERNDSNNVVITGFTSVDNFTTGATLNGNIIEFDRTDLVDAYSVDLTPILTGISVDSIYTANGNIDENRTVTIEDSELIFAGDSDSSILQVIGDSDFYTIDSSTNLVTVKGALKTGIENTDFNYLRITDGVTELVARRNSTTMAELRLSVGGSMTINSDTNGFAGLQYQNDYSADYNNRSLVDKEYVDNAISATSLTYYSENTTAESAQIFINSFSYFYLNSIEAELKTNDLKISTDKTEITTASLNGGLTYTQDGTTLTITNFSTDTNDVLRVRTDNGQGITYSTDYSSTFVDRSLVDKKYVDDAISATSLTYYSENLSFETAAIVIENTSVYVDEDSVKLTTQGTNGSFFYNQNGDSLFITNTSEENSDVLRVRTDNGQGITYHADYSSTFVDRSLVDKKYVDDAVAGGDSAYDMNFAVSDEFSQLTTGETKVTLYAPRDFEIEKVKVSLTSSGSTTTTVDVKVNGTSILSSALSLGNGDFISTQTGINEELDEDDRITVDITAAGTGAKGLKVYLIGKTI